MDWVFVVGWLVVPVPVLQLQFLSNVKRVRLSCRKYVRFVFLEVIQLEGKGASASVEASQWSKKKIL